MKECRGCGNITNEINDELICIDCECAMVAYIEEMISEPTEEQLEEMWLEERLNLLYRRAI